jgi:hypothetical protein
MKLTCVKKLSIKLSFLLVGISMNFANALPSQDGKIYDGFVITISGDTLQGQLEMLSPTINQVKIKFIDENGKKKFYKAKDLQAYAFKVEVWNKESKDKELKWIYYTKKTVERSPVPFSSTEVLMQQEIRGNISIYNYYIETRSEQEMKHVIYLEKNNVLYPITKDNYKEVLKELMTDFPFIKDKIGTKGYTYNVFEETVKEYNQQLRKDLEAIEN